MKTKVISLKEAANIIQDSTTILTGGFVGAGFPEDIAMHIAKRFKNTGHPRDLTLFFSAGQGDGKKKGTNRFAMEGMLKKVIGGHWGLLPALQKLAVENKIQAYNLPLGTLSQMLRDIAAKRPRTITSVGIDTFVDPRQGGGKLNDITKDDLVELIEFDGKTYLAYKTFSVDIAILRGTTSDLHGNISMEKEAIKADSLACAMAAKNSGGKVIVQVERIADSNTLDPRSVVIPGVLVDFITVSRPKYHSQTYNKRYEPSFSCEIKVPVQTIPKLKMSAEKIIARRALFEIRAGQLVNLGFGMPETVSNIAFEEDILDMITLTAETGVIGGLPAGGLNFGAAVNMEALLDQPSQFDFYEGGGLDIAFLGMAQADIEGNLNVSRFSQKIAGAGGFINISQNTAKVVFMGQFTAKGLKVKISGRGLQIINEGQIDKFVNKVEQITFSGKLAVEKKVEVLYITERCVFVLTSKGMQLAEIAPGIDLKRDILDHTGFTPIIKEPLKTMDSRIFSSKKMGIKSLF